MDPSVARLATPEECEQFADNFSASNSVLALEARRRAIELRALLAGAKTNAERDSLAAVYAYEAVLSARRGKKIRASRTWQMIKRHGIINAVERAVRRHDDPIGYTSLAAMNLDDLSFEAVVLKYPEVFSADAVIQSKERLARYAKN